MATDSDFQSTDEFRDTMSCQLEDAWSRGRAVLVEDLLRDVPPPLAKSLLSDLLAIEIRQRRAAGQQPRPDEYHLRFPDEASEISEAFRIASEAAEEEASAPTGNRETPRDRDQTGKDDQLPTTHGSPPLDEAFGRFELIEELGSGGFGTVWLAHDTLLKRNVALKIPRSDRLLADQVGRSVQEARAAARIKHPSVVQVYDAGEEGGTVYIASEYIEGRSLREHLRAETISFREAASLSRRIAEALHAAHEVEIVHRDLKPSNILISEDGNPYVADFGLATIEAECASKERGRVAGTPAYMSPEQARGDDGQLGPATDVYSLGVILFEILTHARPFTGSSRELLQKIQDTPTPQPRRIDPQIPRDLEAICLKCLAKEPQHRYPSAAALADDLQRYLANEPIHARPGTPIGRFWRWCQRKPALAALSGVLACVVVGAVTALSLAYWKTEASLKEAETNLYFHHITAAHQKWLINDSSAAEELLASCPAGRRGLEWHLLNRLFETPHTKLAGAGRAFDISSDGRHFVSAGGAEPVLKVWCRESKDELRRMRLPHRREDWVEWIDLSPDGRTFVTVSASDRTLRLWDAVEGKYIRDVGSHPREVVQAYFVDDGSRIVSMGRDDTVRLWETATGNELRTIGFRPRRIRTIAVSPVDSRVAVSTGHRGASAVTIWCRYRGEKMAEVPTQAGPVTGLAFSADAKLLAVAEPWGGLQIWKTGPPELLLTIGGPLTDYPCPTFDPSGERVAAESWDGSIRVWSASTGEEPRVFRGQLPPARFLRFTPDGNGLAAGGSDNVIRVWDTTAEQGAFALQGTGSPVTNIAFAPKENLLAAAFTDGSVSVRNAVTRETLWTIPVSSSRVFALAFSPDARRLACACEDSTVRIYDVASSQPQLAFEGHERPLRAVAFSPDGRLVASAGIGDTVILWDSNSGNVVRSLSLTTIAIRSLDFHPDGTRLAAGTRDAVAVVWDIQTGEELWRHIQPFSRVWNVAWSPNGQGLAVARGDGNVRIHAASDGQPQVKFGIPARDAPVDLAFSSDGTRLITSTARKLVALWEIPTGREVLRLSGSTTTAPVVAIAPNDQLIATADQDGNILLWPADRGGD